MAARPAWSIIEPGLRHPPPPGPTRTPVPIPSPSLSPSHAPHTHPSSSGPHHYTPLAAVTWPSLDAVPSRSFRPAEHCSCTAPATAPFPTITLGSPRPGPSALWPPFGLPLPLPASPAASSTPSHAKLSSSHTTARHAKTFRDTRPARHPRFPPTHPPVTGSPSPVRLSVFSERKVPAANDIGIEFEARAQDTTRRDRKPSPRPSSSRSAAPALSPPFLPAPTPPPRNLNRHSALDPHVQNSHRTPDPAQQSTPTPQSTSTTMATRTPRHKRRGPTQPDARPDPNRTQLRIRVPRPRAPPPNRSRGPQSNRPQPLPYLQYTIPLPHRTAPHHSRI
ncbi:hypothetical protein HETIRDRAFT_449440 [Heterobasidion irregulare TC 32-1]|uniref:Uncharacterized protein n=1 Tax=Heterobasidion irregulare (strain TC 32-1) TaxID=747525 RepID=W4KET0_HETIT|nr:uncharacterized protein HETIRDRAFT_449440 [Heterobasidion irregulare TC 32-1]ETW83805.1 hypothetical protein HETIRDRAFT_449440 [Heterobasidion irregulare TC 32-1]